MRVNISVQFSHAKKVMPQILITSIFISRELNGREREREREKEKEKEKKRESMRDRDIYILDVIDFFQKPLINQVQVVWSRYLNN